MKLISFDGMYENMKESSGSASKPFFILSASDLLPASERRGFPSPIPFFVNKKKIMK